MLMYYDARPCGMNGMFSTDLVCNKLKGYYPFLAFNSLYQLGTCVQSASDDGSVHVCAAKGETEAAVMLAHFNDDDETKPLSVTVDLTAFGSENGVSVEIYVLDEAHDLEKVGAMTYYGNRFTPELTLPNFTTCLLKLKKK